MRCRCRWGELRPDLPQGADEGGRGVDRLKLALQIGLVANNSGMQSAAKSASNPSSSSYGKYLSLSKLQSKYGATSSVRNGGQERLQVAERQGHDRRDPPASERDGVGRQGAEDVRDEVGGLPAPPRAQLVALPVNTPKLPKGLKGNVDTVAGMRLTVKHASSSRRGPAAARRGRAAAAPYDGGTPDADRHGRSVVRRHDRPRRGRVVRRACSRTRSSTAYGIAPLQAAGLLGQGARLAIVGEAPTPTSDVNQFRNCFGAQGTSLKIHDGSGIKPILESSLDAMVVSMVAPQLDRFDLWVHPIDEDADDGNVLGFLKMLAAPLQATTNGAPLPQRRVGLLRGVRVDGVPVLGVAHPGRRARWRRRRRSGSRSSSPPATPARPRAPAACRPSKLTSSRQEAAGVLARELAAGCWRWAGRT